MVERASMSAPFPAFSLPVPYGARVVKGGVQFSIFSRHAGRVWLMLFDKAGDDRPSREIGLDPRRDRLGDVWHVFVPGARAGQAYLYRMEGSPNGSARRFYNPSQWLLDPYALAVAGAPAWGDRQGLEAGEVPISGARFPKGVIVDDRFDWSSDRPPRTRLADTVIYEAHLRGMTAHPSAHVRYPGTYKALLRKLPYLKRLGVTAVELLPVHEFNEMEYFQSGELRKGLRNYWGYSTMAFFAPNGRYAAGGVAGQQVREFKEMVLAFHKAGIEIILDVVFNHTAEGGRLGPTYSFRGIDNGTYYIMHRGGRVYANYTGCGNTVKCNHPVVRQFILDCLRYWVRDMHVDGFRFDLASIFARGQDGHVLALPPLIDAIAEDPVLRHAKLIAEPWDAAGLYQVGSFPGTEWAEWNGKYRDEVRSFWRGDPGMMGAFARRISGSADLYERPGQSPLKSINFVTSHDGYTLADLVSYKARHNHANCEDNQDGEQHNYSENYGHEGPSEDPAIQAVRRRQVRNFIVTLMLSRGVPMLVAGDEFGRTQRGNNNAYCQDNEISWIDWRLARTNRDLLAFARQAIALRRRYPILRRPRFYRGVTGNGQPPDIRWIGPGGGEPDWQHGASLGCVLSGKKVHTGADAEDDTLLVLFHAGTEAVSFALPAAPAQPWELVLSTEDQWTEGQAPGEQMKVEGRSVHVLRSRPA